MTQIDDTIQEIYISVLKEKAFVCQCKDEIQIEYWISAWYRATDTYEIDRTYGYIYKDDNLSYTSHVTEDLGL